MSNDTHYLVFITSVSPGAGAITAFRLDATTGTLENLGRCTDIENPFFIVLSPNRKFLYSVQIPGDIESDTGYVAAFAIVDNSGRLRKLNQQPAKGTGTCYVDVDPTGKVVVCANYSSGSVGSYPVRSDGSLGEMVSFIQNRGASLVDPDRQEGPHAHSAVISPGGRHMYSCDLGADQILGFALDAEFASLTPLPQSYVRTIGGGGPRHFAYHPQDHYVYANNEMGNSINVYRRDVETGVLTEMQLIRTLPDDFNGTSYTADIKIAPNGRYLYCSNRVHDSIAAYRIGGDGRLTLVDIQSSRGNFAQNLAITPDGRTLLCANMHVDDRGDDGANIALFRINGASGRLVPLGEPVALAKPSCIKIV